MRLNPKPQHSFFAVLNVKFLTYLVVSIQNFDLYFVSEFDEGIVLRKVYHKLPS